ncbi:MAG TPA: tetratricopeptide repeat protein [Clostridia bacterium]|nr:tetratricopeptide repeat protein [Clostridia bacterium]
MLRPRCIPPVIASLMVVLLIVFGPVCPTSLLAQRSRNGTGAVIPRTMDSLAELDIQITYPDSRHAELQLMIELIASGGAVASRTYTNTDGRVSFRVPPGSYRVRITGLSVEDTTSDSFEIQAGEMMHHENVPVQPKPATEGTGTPSGVVNASELGIPGKAAKEYERGMEALQHGDSKKAEDHFHKAIEHYPDYDWAYNSLGVARMKHGDKEGAREAFEKAIAINGHNANAQRNMARFLIGEKKFAEAEEMAKKSLLNEPQDADGLVLLSLAQLSQGKYDDALASARRVHTGKKHQFAFVHLIAARACEAKQLNQEAIAEYRAYLEESPGTPAAQIAKDGLARMQK